MKERDEKTTASKGGTSHTDRGAKPLTNVKKDEKRSPAEEKKGAHKQGADAQHGGLKEKGRQDQKGTK